MQEKWVQSLGWIDSLEKEMATHPSILTREIPWTEEPGELQFTGSWNGQTQLSNYNNNNPQLQRQSPCMLLLLLSHFSRVQLCVTP